MVSLPPCSLAAYLSVNMNNVVALHSQQHRQSQRIQHFLGSAAIEALEDPDITEIIVNPDGFLWIESRSRGMINTGVVFPADNAENLITTIATVVGTVCNEHNPILECELPHDGSRFEGLLPPVSPTPAFVIRKRASSVYTLEDYLKNNIIKDWHVRLIHEAINSKSNIVIAGGTGSGKTTLVNALLAEMVALTSASERFLILEDTYELRCTAKNTLHLHTTKSIDLEHLTRTSMRLRPDRIIVGEVRGKEAHALIKVWNTGHPGGITTIHADSALKALSRLEMLIQEAGVIPQPRIIADTVSYIFTITRKNSVRYLSEVIQVNGFNPKKGRYEITEITGG